MNTAITVVLVGAIFLVIGALYQRAQRNARARRLSTAFFPEALQAKIKSTYPHLSEEQTIEVLEGLRDFFLICNAAGRRMVAMPSQAVDVAWHEFILHTRRYQRFCQQHLGRFLHHTPAEAMESPTIAQQGIKLAWRLACKQEGITPKTPDRLPRLFALDAALNIADGFHYTLNCRQGDKNRSQDYCASHIGCGGGCGTSCGADSGSDGCGGGCGGGD